VFNGGSHSVSVIDAKAGKVVATIPLEGKPELAVADSAAGRIYVNLEDKNEVAVIDLAKREVVARWPLAPGENPTGLAIDVKNHRLFAGCANKLLVMIDAATGQQIGTAPIGDGVDGCAYDSTHQLVFASCRDGTTTIAHFEAPSKLTVVQTLVTTFGARTMALDPVSRKIYLSAADYDPATLSERRPPPLPGTFKVLVFEP
jgi:YVTN family beta-propeller protein